MTPGAEATRPTDRSTRKAEAQPEFRLSDSPSHLLRRAQQYVSESFLKTSLADSVTLRQTVVLAAVSESEGLSQTELVQATGIDRSTLAEMIARMEKKGLVERNAAERDGRAKSVYLTPEGRGALAEAIPAIMAVDQALLEILPRNRRKSFRDTLEIVVTKAGEAAPAAEEAPVARKDEKAARKDPTRKDRDKGKKAKKKRGKKK
jgi:DNA-binding MarR family transcriptional regulator